MDGASHWSQCLALILKILEGIKPKKPMSSSQHILRFIFNNNDFFFFSGFQLHISGFFLFKQGFRNTGNICRVCCKHFRPFKNLKSLKFMMIHCLSCERILKKRQIKTVEDIPLLRERIFPERSGPPLSTHQPGPLCGVCVSETLSNSIQKKNLERENMFTTQFSWEAFVWPKSTFPHFWHEYSPLLVTSFFFFRGRRESISSLDSESEISCFDNILLFEKERKRGKVVTLDQQPN